MKIFLEILRSNISIPCEACNQHAIFSLHRESLIDTKIEQAVASMQSVIELGRVIRDRNTMPMKVCARWSGVLQFLRYWVHDGYWLSVYWFNALWPGRFKKKIDEYFSNKLQWETCCEIALRRMSLDLTDDQVNIGSGNGLVPSGNKPLPEPMLTQIAVAIWCH